MYKNECSASLFRHSGWRDGVQHRKVRVRKKLLDALKKRYQDHSGTSLIFYPASSLDTRSIYRWKTVVVAVVESGEETTTTTKKKKKREDQKREFANPDEASYLGLH